MMNAAAFVMTFVGTFAMNAQETVLKFNQDKKFKIVQFTDTHVIYEDKRCNEAMERMNEVLDAEKPDFVIYTGDLIFGRPAKESLLQAVEPVVSRGIPFGVTWGNHDDEQDMNRKTDPLRMAEDAILVDSTHMSEEEVIDHIAALVEGVYGKR